MGDMYGQFSDHAPQMQASVMSGGGAPILDYQTAQTQFETCLQMYPQLALLPSVSIAAQTAQLIFLQKQQKDMAAMQAMGSSQFASGSQGEPSRKRHRPMTFDRDQVSILVPNSATGRIIGKAGSGLKAINESTNAKLRIEREEMLGDRLGHIHGAEEAQVECVKQVCSIIHNEAPDEQCTMRFLVPDSVTGQIIGKKGAGLARLKDYGVTAHVDREQYDGQRVLHLRGELEGMYVAAAIIINILRAPAPPRRGEGGDRRNRQE